jgi:hypothetical protein
MRGLGDHRPRRADEAHRLRRACGGQRPAECRRVRARARIRIEPGFDGGDQSRRDAERKRPQRLRERGVALGVGRHAGKRAEADRREAVHIGRGLGTDRTVDRANGRIGVAEGGAPRRQPFAGKAGDPKVGEQRLAKAVEQHVARRHVAVHQTTRVDVGQRLRQRPSDRDDLARRQPAPDAEQGRETASFGELEDQNEAVRAWDDRAQP